MRPASAVGVLLLAAGFAGCAQEAGAEASPQDRAWEWLLEQRDDEGRWPSAFVPHVVEAAVASGKDPMAWPSPVPLAEQLEWPSESSAFMPSLRPLHAWALLPGHGGRGEDIVQRLLAGHDGRQFGEPALLNDDAYAVLALAAVDPAEARTHAASLAENQSSDGGWSWSLAGRSETDMAGIVLAALDRAGASGFDPAAAKGFLDRTHAAGGGHGLKLGDAPNCDSTVWALHGYETLGVAAPADDGAYLRALQRTDGALAYQPGGAGNALCTVEAVAALP